MREQWDKAVDRTKEFGRDLDDTVRQAVDPRIQEFEDRLGAERGSWKDSGRMLAWALVACAVVFALVMIFG